MELTANFLTRLIPVTQFNRGQASKIFDRLHSEPELVVLKNNQPSAVILAPHEYIRLTEIEERYKLLLKETKKLSGNEVPQTDVTEHIEAANEVFEDTDHPQFE